MAGGRSLPLAARGAAGVGGKAPPVCARSAGARGGLVWGPGGDAVARSRGWLLRASHGRVRLATPEPSFVTASRGGGPLPGGPRCPPGGAKRGCRPQREGSPNGWDLGFFFLNMVILVSPYNWPAAGCLVAGGFTGAGARQREERGSWGPTWLHVFIMTAWRPRPRRGERSQRL